MDELVLSLNAIRQSKARQVPVGYHAGQLYVVVHPHGGQNNLISQEQARIVYPTAIDLSEALSQK